MTDQVVETPNTGSADGAAFESGFAEARGEPAVTKPEAQEAPKVEAKPEVKDAKVEAKGEAKPEAKEEPPKPLDPVAEKLAELDKRLSFIDKLPDRLRNIEGHIGGITSTLKTAMASAKAVEKAGGDAPTKEEIASAASSDKEWEALKEDFPDWAKVMERWRAEIRASIPKAQEPVDVNGLKSEVRTSLTQTFSQQLAEAETRARQLARVDLRHEDWEDTVKTPEFKAWKEKQAPEIQALADSPKAKDAIRMLDLYEEARAQAVKAQQQKQTNTQRLKSAMTPQGVPAPQATTLDDNAAFELGFKGARGS